MSELSVRSHAAGQEDEKRSIEKVTVTATEVPVDGSKEQPAGPGGSSHTTDDDSGGHRLDQDSAAHQASWRIKAIVLALVILLPLGQTWTNGMLGPLKNTLRLQLKINNSQFGVISASDTILNSIWPVLGGLCLDYFGPNVMILLCTGIAVVGTVLSAIGTTLTAWRLLVAGQIIMGFGISVLKTAQQKLFWHWFGASDLALAFGLELAVQRAVVLVSGVAAIPIRDGTGWYGNNFWVPVGFSGASFLAAVAYVLLTKMPRYREMRVNKRQRDSKKVDPRAFAATLTVLPWSYWMLPMTQLLQSGVVGGYSTSLADIIRIRGYKEDVAGYMSSAQNIVPIVVSPLLGLAIDRYGHRFHYITVAPLLWIAASSLMGFSDVHPVAPLVFSAMARSMNALPFQVCIPLLVADQTKLGTAFGLWRCFQNSGSTIVEIVFGVLQDGTADGGYHQVLSFLIGVKAVAFCIGLAYIMVDYRWLGRAMTMTKAQRLAREAVVEDASSDPLLRRSVVKWVTWAALGLLTSMIITACVVFFRYLA